MLAIRFPEDLDLDSEQPVVMITGTVVQLKGVGLVRQNYPKHSEDWREIVVPSFTTDALRSRLEARGDLEPGGTVFCTRKGTLLSPHNVRRSWRKVRASVQDELPDDLDLEAVVPHTFRKTVATWLEGAESGSIELAAELLGHTSPDVTRQHYIQTRKRVDPVTARILEDLGPTLR